MIPELGALVVLRLNAYVSAFSKRGHVPRCAQPGAMRGYSEAGLTKHRNDTGDESRRICRYMKKIARVMEIPRYQKRQCGFDVDNAC